MGFLSKKLRQKRIWRKIFYERLTEPIHLNIISAFYWVFGSYQRKIDYDLIVRPQHAYCLQQTAELAKKYGYKTVSVIEFGVASGTGLLNITEIAKKLSKKTGINFKIYGFDSGKGMPKPQSFKDHPEYYQEGDFKMNHEVLEEHLPENVSLIIGDVQKTVSHFIDTLTEDQPIGFISFDLDYYFSTKSALEVLKAKPNLFLPLTHLYFDDITLPFHNQFCGALLAINEFNAENKFRKIEHHNFIENQRIFRKASWIKQIYYLHCLDHNIRNTLSTRSENQSLLNPYLDYTENEEKFL